MLHPDRTQPRRRHRKEFQPLLVVCVHTAAGVTAQHTPLHLSSHDKHLLAGPHRANRNLARPAATKKLEQQLSEARAVVVILPLLASRRHDTACLTGSPARLKTLQLSKGAARMQGSSSFALSQVMEEANHESCSKSVSWPTPQGTMCLH